MTKETSIPVDDLEAHGADADASGHTPEAPCDEGEPVAAAPPADLQASVIALTSELEAARAELEAQRDESLRTRAEMENLRRRSEREVENAHKYGLERLVSELLPVVDSMELGLGAASEPGVEVARVREGMELTLKMLGTALEKFGVAVVDPAGEAFDPERHQAMSTQPTDEVAPDSVVMVFQKGYVLNERLVRPAMVVVAEARDLKVRSNPGAALEFAAPGPISIRDDAPP